MGAVWSRGLRVRLPVRALLAAWGVAGGSWVIGERVGPPPVTLDWIGPVARASSPLDVPVDFELLDEQGAALGERFEYRSAYITLPPPAALDACRLEQGARVLAAKLTRDQYWLARSRLGAGYGHAAGIRLLELEQRIEQHLWHLWRLELECRHQVEAWVDRDVGRTPTSMCDPSHDPLCCP